MWKIASDSNVSTAIEIIDTNESSITVKMTFPDGVVFVKSNYKIDNGVCFNVSVEKRFKSETDNFQFTTKIIPPSRCYISVEEMPFTEEYSYREVFEDGTERTGGVKREYTFHGIEEITTPAGTYLAERVHVQNDTGKRIVWRNYENSLIKHEITSFETGAKSETFLIEGTSQ